MNIIINTQDVKLYEENLAPCPFCGNEIQEIFGIGNKWSVRCVGCDSATGDKDTEEQAIEFWKRRYTKNEVEQDGYSTWRMHLDRFVREGVGRFVGADRSETRDDGDC